MIEFQLHFLLIAIVVGILAAFGLGIAIGRSLVSDGPINADPGGGRVLMAASGEGHVSIDTVIVAAPVVDDPAAGKMNLRSWAQQFHPKRDGVWPAIVKRFYELAAGDPEVADYFTKTDLPALQKHFVKVLVALTQEGLTMRTIQRLGDSHTYVANSDGVGITDRVFDKIGRALEAALRSQGVPEDTIDQVVEMLIPIRSVMVHRVPMR